MSSTSWPASLDGTKPMTSSSGHSVAAWLSGAWLSGASLPRAWLASSALGELPPPVQADTTSIIVASTARNRYFNASSSDSRVASPRGLCARRHVARLGPR